MKQKTSTKGAGAKKGDDNVSGKKVSSGKKKGMNKKATAQKGKKAKSKKGDVEKNDKKSKSDADKSVKVGKYRVPITNKSKDGDKPTLTKTQKRNLAKRKKLAGMDMASLLALKKKKEAAPISPTRGVP